VPESPQRPQDHSGSGAREAGNGAAGAGSGARETGNGAGGAGSGVRDAAVRDHPGSVVRAAPIGLVCIDVDGTLVGSSGEVHPAVWPAAAHARERGIRLALCTGRPGFGVTRELAARLDPNGWHCFQNGASVVALGGGRTHSVALARAAVTELIERGRAKGRLLELYTDDDYAFEGPPERARAHAALLGLSFQERPFRRLRGEIVRGQWLVGHDQTELVLAEPHPGLELSLSASPAMPETRFINITAAGVDKGRAVRAIALEYGLPLARVMFVGDSGNDASALRIVGWPVAMANAEPGARALARITVGDVDAGGVAEALQLAEHAGN